MKVELALLGGVLSVLGFSGDLTPSYASGSNTVTGTCSVTNIFVNADAVAVRRLGEIPDRWVLQLTESGHATLNVDQAACSMTIGGVRQQVTYSNLAAVLDSSRLPDPESSRGTSNAMGQPLDLYMLNFSSNNPAFVDFMRGETGLGRFVQHVPGLNYDFSAGLVHQLRFTAPKPARSPYRTTAALTESGFPVYPLTVDFWRETSRGTMMLETSHVDPSRFGIFTRWKIETGAHTAMGQMIGGGGVQQGNCTPQLLISPLTAMAQGKPTLGCLSNESFVTATWRKDLPPPISSECMPYRSQGVDVRACGGALQVARAATARYSDVANAVADGYVPVSTCEATAAGAMGQHWARPDRMVQQSLDPAAPAILLYVPSGLGQKLVGAEYEANAMVGSLPYFGSTPPDPARVSPAPSMFGGKKFDGPMQGHSPAQPWHYDLHVWLFAENPSGVFAQYNPSVHC